MGRRKPTGVGQRSPSSLPMLPACSRCGCCPPATGRTRCKRPQGTSFDEVQVVNAAFHPDRGAACALHAQACHRFAEHLPGRIVAVRSAHGVEVRVAAQNNVADGPELSLRRTDDTGRVLLPVCDADLPPVAVGRLQPGELRGDRLGLLVGDLDGLMRRLGPVRLVAAFAVAEPVIGRPVNARIDLGVEHDAGAKRRGRRRRLRHTDRTSRHQQCKRHEGDSETLHGAPVGRRRTRPSGLATKDAAASHRSSAVSKTKPSRAHDREVDRYAR